MAVRIARMIPTKHELRALGLLCALGSQLLTSPLAETPRALPPGQLPNDQRLAPLKDLDGYFPFTPSATPGEWAKRAEQVRRQMRVALGLWPMPSRTPLNAVIHDPVQRDGYTVERVYFESVPGFYVTGSLYRPLGRAGKLPAILSPHGHWDGGRFTDAGLNAVRREIVQGAERFEEGGRSVLQSRCVQLARMGCIVFHYDMIGYADSQQISYDLAHGFAKQRPEMNTVENWGLFSPQAEAHGQSVMGLQTWNSIRALDFLLDLPDVDPERIGVTGASGGGTQTFVLCALDPRPTLAFPAVMVSTAMQGGCTCENASLLRVDTGNVEFAALFAPKPLGMTAADDWTHEMPTKGFPELKKHYTMLGAPGHVMLKPLLHFGHNYNYVSRAAMYSWVNQQFKLSLPEPIVEEDYRRLSTAEMTVWDDQHPRPEGGPEFERRLLRELNDDAQKQLQSACDSISSFRQLAGGAMDVILGRTLPEAGRVEWHPGTQTDHGTYTEVVGLLRNTTFDEELPTILLRPKEGVRQTVIWTDESGKAGLFKDEPGPTSGEPKSEVQKLLNAGITVVGVDLFEQGEFLTDGKPLRRTRGVKNPREAAAYTFGYNRALFAQRVDDLLTVATFLKAQGGEGELLDVVALDGTGPIAAAFRAQAGDAVDKAAIHTGGFRFGRVLDIHDVNFLPGGAKYGDLPGMLSLGAPGKLWLSGEGERAPELLNKLYEESGAPRHLTIGIGDRQQTRDTAVDWIISKS
jgi:dienelactone hydrolase